MNECVTLMCEWMDPYYNLYILGSWNWLSISATCQPIIFVLHVYMYLLDHWGRPHWGWNVTRLDLLIFNMCIISVWQYYFIYMFMMFLIFLSAHYCNKYLYFNCNCIFLLNLFGSLLVSPGWFFVPFWFVCILNVRHKITININK